jgi:hypothetical protein
VVFSPRLIFDWWMRGINLVLTSPDQGQPKFGELKKKECSSTKLRISSMTPSKIIKCLPMKNGT